LLKIEIKRGVLTALLFFSILLSLIPTAHAGVCDEEPPKWRIDIILFCKLKENNPLVSLQRTITDAASSAPGMQPVANELYTADEQREALNACSAIGCDFNSTVFGSKANGSLMGMTKLASNVVTTESPPVNLAYYIQHNARKIPVINQTAYAQETQYTMMSVIMLIVGVLIITRKRINPQTVVTVQTALPRVFISLLLITFSYPIGALMAVFLWNSCGEFCQHEL